MNRKGVTTRDTRLSVRVPVALKRAIEREAVRGRRTVADVVISTLETSLVVTGVERSDLRPHEAEVVRAFADWVLRNSQHRHKQRRVARNGGK